MYTLTAHAAVTLEQAPNGSVSVVTDHYQVTIGADGCPQSIRVGGVEMLGRYGRFASAGGVLDHIPPGNYGIVHPKMTRAVLGKPAVRKPDTVVATGQGRTITYTFRDADFDIVPVCSPKGSGPLMLFPSDHVVRSLDLLTDKVVSMSEGYVVGQTQEGMRWVTRPGPVLRFAEKVDGYACYYWWSQVRDGTRRAVSIPLRQSPSTFTVRPLAHPEPADAIQFVVKADDPGLLMPGGKPVRFDVLAINVTADPTAADVVFEVRDYCTQKVCARVATALTMAAHDRKRVQAEVPLSQPGPYRGVLVVRCDGKTVRELAWVFTYDFPNYRPALTRQPDFKAFWSQALDALAKVPVDAKLTLNPKMSTPQAQTYEASLATLDGERVWAWYCKPRKPGRYPVLYFCPPTGVYRLPLWVGRGNGQYCTFSIAIHGFDLRLSDMPKGDDPRKRYHTAGLESPRTARWRTIYANLVRGMDFLCSRPEVDPNRIAVGGSSQGGGLAMVLAGLDPRVAALLPQWSGLPRLDWTVVHKTGYWPFGAAAKPKGQTMDRFLKTLSYFDAANFTPDIRCPTVARIGMLDWVTASGNQVAALAHLKPAQVELICDVWEGHGASSVDAKRRFHRAWQRFLAGGSPVARPSK